MAALKQSDSKRLSAVDFHPIIFVSEGFIKSAS